MKRILCILLVLVMAFSVVVFADDDDEVYTGPTFTIKKTDVKAESVYNRSGYAVVENPNPENEYFNLYGLVDKNGKYIIAEKASDNYPRYNTFGDTFFISDGIIIDYMYGQYYKLDGSRAFDFDDDHAYLSMRMAMPFWDGKALVQFSSDSPYYVIDPEGNVLKEMDSYPGSMVYGGEGFTISTNFSDTVKYYDYEGNLAIDLTGRNYTAYGGVFFGGYAWVRDKDTNLCGFINTKGEEVVPCMFEEVGGFFTGLAMAQLNGKRGCITPTGIVVIDMIFDDAFGFYGNSLGAVKENDKWGVINYQGLWAIPCEYDDISSFIDGVAYAVKDGYLYVITEGEAIADGWQKIDGEWYYYLDGEPQTGWIKDGGSWYYMDASGVMQKGWQKISGKWYYMNSGGKMLTGWQKISGKWYYFNSGGIMQTGWQKISGKWYYFNSSGDMATGWKDIGSKTYYFKPSGEMAAGEWCKGWYLNANGTWTYPYRASWKQNSRGWYYEDTSGWYAKSTTITIDGKAYKFDAKGYWVK